MHLCLFLLYMSFRIHRASNGGLIWRFVKLPLVYVREMGIFSLIDFPSIYLTFVDSNVVPISLETF
jgi:hypothetical protein